MKKHFNITITGRVQGVFFRGATRNIARQYNIKGLVKNNYDGSVYIEAEGETNNLNMFIKWCFKGPDHADVKEVIIEEGPVNDFKTFYIKY